VFNEVIKTFDCSILQGFRPQHLQDAAFRAGRSKLKWPQSMHNRMPSMAVDVAPYPIDWDDHSRFYFFSGYVLGIAQILGVGLMWGGDWDSDTQVMDQSFFDLPHFELRNG